MRRSALVLAVALALSGCTSGDAPTTNPSSTSDGPVASSSAPTDTSSSPRPTSSATDLEFRPVNTVVPGGVGPGSVASLPVIEPDDLGVALVSVDHTIGAVSWWDGFDWKSYEVPVALDHNGWATDGRGGVILQDTDFNVWHLEPFTDEPMMVVEAPPNESEVFNGLVGGGVLDGRRFAFVEQSRYGSPETASGDIVAFDVEGRADRVLLEGTSGWESGTSQISILERDRAVMTVHAECFTAVVVRRLDGGFEDEVARGPDCAWAISAAGTTPFGEPAALAVVASNDPALPAVLLSRTFTEFPGTEVQSLPHNDQDWLHISPVDTRVLISANGVAIVQDDQFQWRRLDLVVPGEVRVADDLAIG